MFIFTSPSPPTPPKKGVTKKKWNKVFIALPRKRHTFFEEIFTRGGGGVAQLHLYFSGFYIGLNPQIWHDDLVLKKKALYIHFFSLFLTQGNWKTRIKLGYIIIIIFLSNLCVSSLVMLNENID